MWGEYVAHVLVAQRERAIGTMISSVLDMESDHTVTRVSTGEQMYQTLLAAPHPFVVFYYTTLLLRELPEAATDPDARPPDEPWQLMLRQVHVFQRHRFIETRAWTLPISAKMQPFYDYFDVAIVRMPFHPDELLHAASEAARRLE